MVYTSVEIFVTIVLILVLYVITTIIVGLYMLPTIIAYRRKHQNKIAILALNLFLGWMLVGWVGALVWSVINHKEK